jgi:hypothetical protein
METQNLKQQITDRINSIENVELLHSIQQFLETTSDKDLAELLQFVNEKLPIDKRDYTSYIKEWVKSM